ncbi:MAG: ABC transporter substrate-binding protein [Candidatus Marinimicrobia bacterium]|nr:ABC transporter substrate-binding protein [Candidatus Neomarinimicrobiota bacterium]
MKQSVGQILKVSLVIILVLAAGFILLNPWTRNSDDSRHTLSFWSCSGQKEDVPFIVTAFNSAQDSIRVISNAIPWQEQEKKVLTAILSDNPPDAVSQFIPIVKWASRMALIPLDKFIERDHFDTTAIFPALWEEMRWQGHIFGIPVSSASYAFYYNKKLFRQAGLDPERPPKTWAEVIEYDKKLTRYDKAGNIIQMGFIPFYKSRLVASQNSPATAIIIAWEKGASFLSKDGKTVTLVNPALIEATQWILDFLKPYPIHKIEAFSAGFGYGDQQAFAAEKVAMMILPNIFPDYLRIHAPNVEYGIALTPTMPGCQMASSTGSWWIAIPRGSKNPEAAWDFIKFSASKKVQLDAYSVMDQNLFPANRLATADSIFLRDGKMQIFVTHLEHAQSPTIVPMAHDVFWREFYTAQEQIVFGNQSIEKALGTAQTIIQHELDKALTYDEYVRTKMNFFDK